MRISTYVYILYMGVRTLIMHLAWRVISQRGVACNVHSVAWQSFKHGEARRGAAWQRGVADV